MLDYINVVKEHPSGVLLFEQGMNVREWTKGDVFAYFGNKERYASHSQIAGGIVMVCKNAKSCAMVDEWYYICHNHYELLTDAPSKSPNYPEFIEHRHDQSVLDLLAIKYDVAKLSLSEAYRIDEDWTKMKQYPIWVTRKRDRKKKSLIRRVGSKIKKMLQIK